MSIVKILVVIILSCLALYMIIGVVICVVTAYDAICDFEWMWRLQQRKREEEDNRVMYMNSDDGMCECFTEKEG